MKRKVLYSDPLSCNGVLCALFHLLYLMERPFSGSNNEDLVTANEKRLLDFGPQI